MSVRQELRADEILVLTIDAPPVNALSATERAGLVEGIARAEAGDVKAVVIVGANARFIAGANIREFDKPPTPPFLPEVMDAIEACPRPVIAAIAGQALGGGLEVALACHYRIAAPDAKLGLPEVTLGIVPGAGGTQRLPRLIEPLAAAEMIAYGRPLSAAAAARLGLIDQTAEDPFAAALALAQTVTGADLAARRVSRRSPALTPDLEAGLAKLAAEVGRRGGAAPGAGVELVRVALSTPYPQGLAREREVFETLRAGPEAAALRHAFFAERAAARAPDDLGQAAPRPVSSVGIVGAGLMGTGIAISLADAGLPVTLLDSAPAALARGLSRIGEHYQESAAKGRIEPAEAAARTARIVGAGEYEALGSCDLIVEAAFEDMGVKQGVFAALDKAAKPGAILATNTSYLDVNALAAATSRPEDVLGLHYFSPAQVMRLLEVVRAAKTSPDVLAAALALAKRTGKTAVIAGVGYGFIGNRMLSAYFREAGLLILEGAGPDQVDDALTRFGMAMGPFAVADLAGLEIGVKTRAALRAGEDYEPWAVRVHEALAAEGDLGRKSGQGFYVYAPKPLARTLNPRVPALLEQARRDAGVTARPIEDSEIVERCLYALVNEGGHVLDEGVAARASDIDVVWINGYGFPRWRGGPIHHAERLGWPTALAAVERFQAGRFGRWWRPAARLRTLAEAG